MQIANKQHIWTFDMTQIKLHISVFLGLSSSIVPNFYIFAIAFFEIKNQNYGILYVHIWCPFNYFAFKK